MGIEISPSDFESLLYRYADRRAGQEYVQYPRLVRNVMELDPQAIASKWSAEDTPTTESRTGLGPGSPAMRPEEVLVVGKVRRAVQRFELGRRDGTRFDLLTAFRGVDHGRKGTIPWPQVAHVLNHDLGLLVEVER